MKADEMLMDVHVTKQSLPPGLDVRGVTCHSRAVRPGDLFVAVRGAKSDGLAHLAEAIRAGAAAVAVGAGRFEEARGRLSALGEEAAGVGLIELADEREGLALLGRNVQRRPDLELRITGITGTNGKTTTSWILAAIFEAAGVPCGVMGTVERRFGGRSEPASRTTPEGPEIHAWLRRIRDAGAGACAMEVSSHALDLRRVAGLRFSAAVFTNLTRDHLDYHRDMESYFAAKKILFTGLSPEAHAVINGDDPWGRRLARESLGRVVLFGEGAGSTFRMTGFQTGTDGTTLRVVEAGGEFEIRSPLIGRPNAWNLLAAAAAARAQGISREAVREGAARAARVPGRLQRIEAGQPFTLVVDYAHTDDALKNVLEALRPLTRGRLITVFGCGGNRDRAKRPLMGAQVARLSDLFWVTSDNPRDEEPMAIIGMILEGVRGFPGAMEACRVEPDREAAIRAAVAEARPGDTVVVAGKGHERTQILGARTIPFDDAEVSRRALEERLGRGEEGAGGDAA